MIKVIKEGTRNRIECDYCVALLAYDEKDIRKREQHWGPCPCDYNIINDYSFIKYIICPHCQNEIVMEGTR